MKQQISTLMLKKYINTPLALPEYNPLANFDWIRTQSGLPWLPLQISLPAETILKEIANIQDLLITHRDDYAEHRGWKSFCIHGKSYDATREDSYYSDHRPYDWTNEAREHMPMTVDYFQNIWPGSGYQRIRVMLLEPGGYIALHKDTEDPGLRPINIAITHPTSCDFVMERYGCIPFEAGSAFWLDNSNRHTVFNHSNQRRWHIIVHQSFDNIKYQNQVVSSYKTLYNNINETRNNSNSR